MNTLADALAWLELQAEYNPIHGVECRAIQELLVEMHEALERTEKEPHKAIVCASDFINWHPVDF